MVRSPMRGLFALILLATAAPVCAETSAQTPLPSLRDTAFVTCRDAQAMPPDERKALVLKVAQAASRFYQARIADSEETGQQIGWLIRSACTINPQAYLSTVVARAVRVVGEGVEPPLRQPLDMEQAMFVSCAGAQNLTLEQRWDVGRFIGTEAAAHYHLVPTSEWTPNYVAALVHNACMMYPDAYFLGIVGRAVQSMSTQTDEAGNPVARAE